MNVLVLVDAHEVEPILLLRARPIELDLSITKGAKEPLIPNIAHPIQSKLGSTFLQQNGLDKNIVRLWCPSVVIDESRNLQQIKRSQMSFLVSVSPLL